MTKSSISKGVIKDIIIVVIGVLIIWIGLQLVFGTQNPFYVVSSGSMVPVLQVYDVLIVQGNDPFSSVKLGDIIVFNRPSGHDRVIVHRVVSIIDDNPYTIRTKGDANPASIPGTDFPITEEEFIGKVAYVVPQVGYVTRILTPPINYIIIAIIIGVMIFKQFQKKKSEKELSFEDPFETKPDDELGLRKDDTQNQTKTESSADQPPNPEKLDDIPKDLAYTDEKPTKIDEKLEDRKKSSDEESEKKD